MLLLFLAAVQWQTKERQRWQVGSTHKWIIIIIKLLPSCGLERDGFFFFFYSGNGKKQTLI